MDDTLEDIFDGTHKSFMKQYLKNWPFPHLTHYKIGQSINVDLNGVLSKCTVDAVDSSLMQVVFEVSISFCAVFSSDFCLFCFPVKYLTCFLCLGQSHKIKRHCNTQKRTNTNNYQNFGIKVLNLKNFNSTNIETSVVYCHFVISFITALMKNYQNRN